MIGCFCTLQIISFCIQSDIPVFCTAAFIMLNCFKNFSAVSQCTSSQMFVKGYMVLSMFESHDPIQKNSQLVWPSKNFSLKTINILLKSLYIYYNLAGCLCMYFYMCTCQRTRKFLTFLCKKILLYSINVWKIFLLNSWLNNLSDTNFSL